MITHSYEVQNPTPENKPHARKGNPTGFANVKKCGANLKGGPCQRPAMPNGRCRQCGGKTPAPGPTHPNYRTGQYSRAYPAHLRENVLKLLDDPELLSLRSDIALHKSRHDELVTQLTSAQTWQKIQDAKNKYARSRSEKDFAALSRICDEGAAEGQVWAEARETGLYVNQLVKTELTLLQAADSFISTEQAHALAVAWENVLLEACNQIPDIDTQRAVRAFVHRRMAQLDAGPKQARIEQAVVVE